MPAHQRLLFGSFLLDLRDERLWQGTKNVRIGSKALDVLRCLTAKAGQLVTKDMLLEAVWDYNFDPQTNIIDQHVSRLRQKIDKGFDPPLVQTIRGMGYSLRA